MRDYKKFHVIEREVYCGKVAIAMCCCESL